MNRRPRLTIDDDVFEVQNCSYSIYRVVNPQTNEPTPSVCGGEINVSLWVDTYNTKLLKLMLLPAKEDMEKLRELLKKVRMTKYYDALPPDVWETFSDAALDTLSGSIELEFSDNEGYYLRRINFANAFLSHFSESFTRDARGIASVTICARTLDISGNRFDIDLPTNSRP